MTTQSNAIEYWRKKVDEVDEEFLRLIARRIEYSFEIAKIKKENKIQLKSLEREKEIIDRMKFLNVSKMKPESIERIFVALIEESRATVRMLVRAIE